jgi:putative transposase
MRSLPNGTKMVLSIIVQQYKSSVTRKIRHSSNDSRFQWQKSFYDHIITTERSFRKET